MLIARSPALDRMQKSVRSVDAAIRETSATLDDLSHRINRMRLGTPSDGAAQSPSRSRPSRTSLATGGGPASPSRASAAAFTVPEEYAKEAASKLASQATLRDSLAARFRTAKTVVTRQEVPQRSSGDSAGPMFINAPKSSAQRDGTVPAAGPSSSAQPPALSSSPSTSFAGIKLDLGMNAAELAQPSTRSSGSRGPGGAVSISRSHSSAAKYSPSTPIAAPAPAALASGDSTSTASSPLPMKQHAPSPAAGGDLAGSPGTPFMPGGFSFGFNKPPAQDKPAQDAKKPEGFFSLSGFK